MKFSITGGNLLIVRSDKLLVFIGFRSTTFVYANGTISSAHWGAVISRMRVSNVSGWKSRIDVLVRMQHLSIC